MGEAEGTSAGLAGASPGRVRVISQRRLHDGHFALDQVTLSYERHDGEMSAPVTRLLFERGDAVAVLPYDSQTGRVVLVRQFRHAAWVRGGPGWLWEVVAGACDAGCSAEAAVRSEAMEEAGYALGALRFALTFYPSPGACSERIHVYLSPVTAEARVGGGGGLPGSGEDTFVASFALDEALAMVEDGRICDGKTIVALQYLARHWPRVAAP